MLGCLGVWVFSDWAVSVPTSCRRESVARASNCGSFNQTTKAPKHQTTKKKKQWPYKPGSVHESHGHKCHVVLAACHLSTTGVTTSLYRSTLQLGRTALSPRSPRPPRGNHRQHEASLVYANFQHPECTARMSPYAWWALTPPSHPYPTLVARGGYFLLHRPAVTDPYPLGSGLSCVARTFLSPPPHAKRKARPTASQTTGSFCTKVLQFLNLTKSTPPKG